MQKRSTAREEIEDNKNFNLLQGLECFFQFCRGSTVKGVVELS